MAIFNFISDLNWNSYDDVTGGTVFLMSATAFRYTSASGFFVILAGTGFTYDANHVPTGGTITGMQVYRNGSHYAAYSGLDYALTDFALYSLGLQSGVATPVAPDSTALYTGLRSGDDVIHASELGKDISGYAGNDTIYGNGGDDWLNGGAGVDRFYGGTGIDGVYFTDVGAGGHGVRVNMALGTGNILDDGYGNVETASGVEIYQGSKFRDRLAGGLHDDTLWGEGGGDSLIGNAGNDALYGGDGSDLVTGDAGNDTMMGGKGADSLDGGTGVNLLAFWDVAAPGHGVRVNLGRVTGQVIDDGYGTTDNATHFQNLDGSTFGDWLTGTAGANIIWGEAGADHLFGGAGNDSLYGNSGRDSIFGGNGDDEVEGDKGRDYFDGGTGYDHLGFWNIDATGHGVVVNLELATQNILDDGYGNVETVVGFEILSGSAFGDNFTGSALAETFWGNDSADWLNGGGGNDALFGGADGDVLDGISGDDSLWGGGGNDYLNGGDGQDWFIFGGAIAGSDGIDTLANFQTGIDVLAIPAAWAPGLAAGPLAPDQYDFTFQSSQATTPDQRFIYDLSFHYLYFDADGSESAYSSIPIALLEGGQMISSSDIYILN